MPFNNYISIYIFTLSTFAFWASLAAVLSMAAFMILVHLLLDSVDILHHFLVRAIVILQTFGILIPFPTASSWLDKVVNIKDIIKLRRGWTLLIPIGQLNDLLKALSIVFFVSTLALPHFPPLNQLGSDLRPLTAPGPQSPVWSS